MPEIARLCQLGRHLCGGRDCACSCHTPMTVEYARSIILRTAGQRLWPDDPTALVEQARKNDPFGREFLTALETLGLS